MKLADLQGVIKSDGKNKFTASEVEALIAEALAQVASVAAPKPNPIGNIVVQLADSDGVYPDARSGGKSTKVVECMVELPDAGIKIPSAIYARYTPTAGGSEVEFQASFPRGCKAVDAFAKNEFLARVEAAAAQWPGWDTATEAAMMRLGLRTSTASARPSGQTERPRLVKSIQPIAAPATQPVAATA